MSRIPRWQLWLIPVPIVSMLLALAWLLDAFAAPALARLAQPSGPETGSEPSPSLRLGAGAIDLLPLIAFAAILPPAFAWTLGSLYLLFRDAGPYPISLGKRALGLRACNESGARLGFVESFARNLPLLLPYLGPSIEAVRIARGARRLGDRLAETRVLRVASGS